MRGFAVLLAYVVGLLAIISIGIVGLMSLPLAKPTPFAPVAATAAHKASLAKPVKQIVAHHDEHAKQKRKTAHATRKRTEDAPTFAASGLNAYGYAQEPRRVYGYPFPLFGR